ncbi:MAG: hypothetical protein O3C36_04765, partial [archaeon]|nr:hypothetical protein [archaeon]
SFRPALNMGDRTVSLRLPLGLVALLLFSLVPTSHPTLEESQPVQQTQGQDPGVSDVPTWRIGDRWVYGGTFDPTILVTDTGVDATVGEIQGDTTTEVIGITTQNVDNMSVLAYTLRSSANFDKSGVSLEGYTGNVYIQYTQTEYLRVSDLAVVRNEIDMYIRFVPSGISFLEQILGDITITTTYSPVSENYDFPLRANERWTTNTTSYVQWSGQSDYITPFPPPKTDTNSTTWVVTDVGKPTNAIGQSIDYGGCNASYKMMSYNRDGDSDGYRWYCPEVGNFAWLHTEDDIGLTIDFRLKRYDPVGATGVAPYTNPGTRATCLEVTPERSITALNTPMAVWVNASSSCFSNPAGLSLDLHHEHEGIVQSLTTAANGSAWTVFDIGDAVDSSATQVDYASHGLVAKSGNYVGATTVTLDEYLVGLDVFADEGATVILRTRCVEVVCTTIQLNALSGYNVLPGDVLDIEVAFKNRGITTTLETDARLTLPDGSASTVQLPSLATYQTHKVQQNWTVPLTASIGNLQLLWEADISRLNSADADVQNNLGSVDLFVGSMPTAVAMEATGLTREAILINASNSFDEDGGTVSCTFNVPFDDGTRTWDEQRFVSPSCMLNYTWTDDGVYPVEVTVIDEERDETMLVLNITVENRAPKIEVRSQRTEAKVEHPITLYAYANDSDSEKVWPGVVDIHWPGANCKEGYYTRICTTTATTEGWKTFTAVGTDDDNSVTTATFDVRFTNIKPHSINVQMLDLNGPVLMDAQNTWHVDEDQAVTVQGQAQDSVDDIEDLTHTWWPDDAEPSLIRVFDGRTSSFDMVWTEAGLHKMRLEVTDTEGASSGVEERWVSVNNLPPTIQPLDSVLPVAEGQSISVSGSATDTPSDLSTLVKCWDIDPSMDSDDLGSADDDCDVLGDNLTVSWNRSGTHKLVYHVTDNDGAHASEVLEVTVLNTPPLVRTASITCTAHQVCILDASSTFDALNDVNDLTVVWDLDVHHDSNEDGILDNDADLIGKTVEHTFRTDGLHSVKVIAWDEDPERPGTKVVTFTVLPADRTALENLGAALVGEEANPFAQLGLLAGVLFILLLLSRRRSRPDEDAAWSEVTGAMAGGVFEDRETHIAQRRPEGPPPDYLFHQSLQEAPSAPERPGPPLPPSGLPEGWSMEQWEHYGQQWLDARA